MSISFPIPLISEYSTRHSRFALNYKKIPYTVIDLDITSIETTAKSLGVRPTIDPADGTPRYTVPFIRDVDPTTGTEVVISDSFKVAQYLDKAYPGTPRIIPLGTDMLQSTFCQAVFSAVTPLLAIIRPITAQRYLTPEFREGVKKRFGEEGVSKRGLSAEQEQEAWGNFILRMSHP